MKKIRRLGSLQKIVEGERRVPRAAEVLKADPQFRKCSLDAHLGPSPSEKSEGEGRRLLGMQAGYRQRTQPYGRSLRLKRGSGRTGRERGFFVGDKGARGEKRQSSTGASGNKSGRGAAPTKKRAADLKNKVWSTREARQLIKVVGWASLVSGWLLLEGSRG